VEHDLVMWRASVGSVVGAVFGLVYIMVNAGTLPSVVGIPVRVLGVLAFLVVLVAVFRARPAADDDSHAYGGFGRGYWMIVAVEVVMIATGVAVLGGPLHAPQTGVA
jgi:hypothetical protein